MLRSDSVEFKLKLGRLHCDLCSLHFAIAHCRRNARYVKCIALITLNLKYKMNNKAKLEQFLFNL